MKVLMIFLNILNMYKVVWENKDIKIPLNEDTYQYYEMPKANLYYNNILIKTDEYYERGVNHTNLNVINSRHVKTFKIDYRVRFDEYGISSTQTIHFNVVDTIGPEFIKIPEIKMPVKTKALTEKSIIEGLIYHDNYYSNDELVVKVNGLANVNINIPNKYELEYEIMDPSFNTTKQIGYYIVENNVKPEIKYNDLITINYGESFNYMNYFKFIDEHDKNLKTSANLSNVNFNKLGTYPIIVSATNDVGLTTTVTANIEIIDKEKPSLVLKTNNIINVNECNSSYLEEIILSVSDNYDKLTINDVIIEGYIDFNVVDKYDLTYYITDSSNNSYSKKIVIEVKDLEKPEIKLIKELNLNINDNKPNWFNYFNITDNYDDFTDLSVTFNDKNINYNKLGIQMLEVTVTDLNKNKITQIFEVNILDLIAPEIIQMEEIIITDFTSKNNEFYKTFFAITDNYDNYSDINVTINNHIDYEKIGQYEVLLIFSDKSNNTTIINTFVYILDITKPSINLTTNVYYYYINNELPKLDEYIMNIGDNNTSKENLKVNIVNNVNYNKVGKYEVVYEVFDESNNMNYAVLSIYVDKTKTKLISGENIYIETDNPFIIGNSIKLSDDVVKTLSYPNYIDTSKPGVKEVLHVAYDARGNYEEFLQTIYIEDNKTIEKYKNNIIVTIIGGIIIAGYYLYEKKNNNNF